MSELTYTGSYKPGDRIVCTNDNIDGSYAGEEGTVLRTYRQGGGTFAPERNVEVVIFDIDDENDLAGTEDGRKQLLAALEDGDIFAPDSDDFEFEAA